MVDIVVPLPVVQTSSPFCTSTEISSRIVVVFKDKMNMSLFSERPPDSFGKLGENVWDGVVNNRVHRIKAQTVEVILLQPIKRIVNKEVADHSTSAAIEINRIAPRGF